MKQTRAGEAIVGINIPKQTIKSMAINCRVICMRYQFVRPVTSIQFTAPGDGTLPLDEWNGFMIFPKEPVCPRSVGNFACLESIEISLALRGKEDYLLIQI